MRLNTLASSDDIQRTPKSSWNDVTFAAMPIPGRCRTMRQIRRSHVNTTVQVACGLDTQYTVKRCGVVS